MNKLKKIINSTVICVLSIPIAQLLDTIITIIAVTVLQCGLCAVFVGKQWHRLIDGLAKLKNNNNSEFIYTCVMCIQ